MKKILILILCLYTMAFTAGCGVSEADYQKAVSERDDLKIKIKILENKLADSDKEVSFASERIAELKKEIKGLSEEIRQLKDERQDLLARLDNDSNNGDNQRHDSRSGEGRLNTDHDPAVDVSPEYYIVKPNDTLWRIARNHKVPLKTLIKLNNIGSNLHIRVGQKIRVK